MERTTKVNTDFAGNTATKEQVLEQTDKKKGFKDLASEIFMKGLLPLSGITL